MARYYLRDLKRKFATVSDENKFFLLYMMRILVG
jgi:hypothetical protein